MIAVSFGVVYVAGRIVRIINPTFEEELGLHHLSAGETMRRFRKDRFGVGDLMSLEQLATITNDPSIFANSGE